LVVKAGSVNETPEQSGIAHFLEHMMFNGTEAFPKNELSAFLGSLGFEFGPDFTASTDYDETWYKLSLSSSNTELISSALDVLVQWAAHATLHPDDVEAERGVVDAEWRESNTGGSSVREAIDQFVFAGTPYQGHPTLGSLEAIEAVSAETLREFYEDWYQPQNMAVIAVGDFHSDTVAELIEEKFSSLTPRGALPNQPEFRHQPPSQPTATVVLSQDISRNSALVYFTRPKAPDQNTASAIADNLAAELVFEMVRSRISDDILGGDNPARSVAFFNEDSLSALALPAIAFDATTENIVEALEQFATELERAKRFGFNDEEFQRAKDKIQAALDADLASLDTIQHREIAQQLRFHFSAGAHAMSGTDTHQIFTNILSQITPEMTSSWIKSQLAYSHPIVILNGPQADAEALPDADFIVELFMKASELTLTPRDSEADTPAQLMEPPDPVAITSQRNLLDDFAIRNVTEFTFANGVRVLYRYSDITAGQAHIFATSPGGESLLEPSEFIGWDIPEGVISNSGIGAISRLEFQRFTQDKTFSVTPFISSTREGFEGRASTEDLEHLFAYIHLLLTQPKVDPVALEAVLSFWDNQVAPEYQILTTALNNEFSDARYGDNLHFALLPPAELLADITASDVAQLFQDRFANAADFTFIVVGDLSLAELRNLAQRYLGTLPTSASRESWRNLEPPPPPGVVNRNVTAGPDDLGYQVLSFTTPIAPSLLKIQETAVLSEIVETRIVERIREELSATYAPDVEIQLFTEPTAVIEAQIVIAGEQNRITEVADIVVDELTGLHATLTLEEFNINKGKLEQNYRFVSNEYWIEAIGFAVENPTFEMGDVLNRRGWLARVEYENVRQLAREVFPEGRYIQILTQRN